MEGESDGKQRAMKVLVVDDLLPNALILEAYLRKLDEAETLVFTDPAQALAWCEENDPDLLLVDYLMPEIDGLEFVRRIRANSRHTDVPLVIITASDEREVRYRALELGANDFLSKPVDALELTARARNMLKLRARSLALVEANHRLHKLATMDMLTEVYVRRHFIELATAEFSRARRYGKPASVIMLDADHFKKVNDTYGHPAGDQVLIALAGACRRAVRTSDFVGRLGGEEFAVCLPETRLDGATTVAERMREFAAETVVEADGHQIRFTLSLGVAELGEEDTNLAALMARADRALYQARHSGRNRVIAEQTAAVA